MRSNLKRSKLSEYYVLPFELSATRSKENRVRINFEHVRV